MTSLSSLVVCSPPVCPLFPSGSWTSHIMSCSSSTQSQDMFSTLWSCSNSFHSQQGIREQQRCSVCVAEEEYQTPTSSQTPDQDGVSSLCQESCQETQLWVCKQGYRRLRGEMNSPRGCCYICLGTEGDASTGYAFAGGVQCCSTWAGLG